MNGLPETKSQYKLIGHVSRSHGVDGTVLIVPVIEVADAALFDDIDLIRLENERGDLIPARIQSMRSQEKDDPPTPRLRRASRITFFAKFEHINNQTEAEEISHSAVYADKDKIEPFISESYSLVSFEVLNDKNERIGEVKNVIKNPGHPILKISTESGNILVPSVDEYVDEVDEDGKTIRCKNLDRLEVLK